MLHRGGVIQFRGDKNIFTLHDTLIYRAFDPLTCLLLILVVVCAIEESIAGFDGLEKFSQSLHPVLMNDKRLTLYTVSAAVSLGTFQRPKPTRGIS